MAEPFLGEVRMTSFNFAPKGWAPCNGQLLSISQNAALFSILGTTYGGNGTTNFALPDLQGRVPVHWGGSVVLGESGGVEGVALTIAQIPAHSHRNQGSVNQATTYVPGGNVFAAKARRGADVYAPSPPNTLINSQDAVGNNETHDNRQPSLVVNFVIALQGIFPSRN
jgi:microcystin-dependent protein